MAKLLVVDDDHALCVLIADFLSFEHHQIETAETYREALDKLFVSGFDLLIVDWDLPDGSGIDLIREFRARGGIAPVLILTGKDKISDKQIGFRVGSDDYLTKPINIEELGLRVDALLRRPRALVLNTLTVRDIILYPESYRVTKGGQAIDLLPKEFALLQFLMRNTNRVFTADALLKRVWESDTEATPHAVVACLGRLRQKIESSNQEPLIKTIRGAGYKLAP